MLYLAFIFPFVVVVAVVALASARRAAFSGSPIAAASEFSAQSASRRIRRRNFAAIVAALIIATTLVAAGLLASRTTQPQALLDPLHLLLLTPILTAIVAVAFFAFVPSFRESAEARSAELVRRTPLSFGPRAAFVLPITAAVVLAGVIVALGLVADRGGRSISYSFGPGGTGDAGGGFPGFAYGIPILVGIGLLAAVAVVALRRIASSPRPTDASLRGADQATRLLAIRVVTKAATSAMLLTVGFLLIFAGDTASGMNGGSTVDIAGNPISHPAALQTIAAFGTVGLWLGIAFVVTTIVFLVGAISDATRKPFEVAPVPGAPA